MDKYLLLLRKDGATSRSLVIGENGVSIGRASDCSIVLNDPMVSRHHARIWLEDENVYVEDMGSRNGVIVNRRRVWRGCLYDGDEIFVGDQNLSIRRVGQDEEYTQGGSSITFVHADTVVERMVRAANTSRLLGLYKATQLMASVFNTDQLVRETLNLLFDTLPIRRGFILTRESEAAAPVVRAFRAEGAPEAPPPLSSTILRHVFEEKASILTLNAQEDPRFEDAGSVSEFGIRAAMCAPLHGQETLEGAVYVDVGEDRGLLTNDDLELLTAIGRVVGVALENARLHQEKMRGERLAAIGQATAGIGHCVKNLLTGVKAGGEFLDAGIAESEWKPVKKGRALMRTSIERIEEVVLNLLTFSRDHEIEMAPTDVDGLVRDVLELVRPRAEKIGVTLDFAPGAVGAFPLDGPQMYRVLLNLVTNALDACEPTGGTVTATTRRDSEGCFIEIHDTGPGISEEIRPRLFQAFASTKGSAGTGLGLACSEKIVRAHGGSIEVESAPGQGAVFSVFVPDTQARATKTFMLPRRG